MKILITGGCGFLGSNLAADSLQRGDNLTIFDNLSRMGAQKNLEWLRSQGEFTFLSGDIRNSNDVEKTIQAVRPDIVFHLAGQVAMTTSIEDPRKDFEINALGTFNLLESLRVYSPHTAMIYSSTNKVYGDLEQYHYTQTNLRYECTEHPMGFDESIPLDFHSPYGTSKGSADQYCLDYARIFGLKTVVFRHSSMYGGRQFSTYDQGWIGWFCQKALEKKRTADCPPFTISGTGMQVRDVLHAEDMKRLYQATINNLDVCSGNAYNIGGGPSHSLSLLELFQILEDLCGVKLSYTRLPVRESDQKVFIADISKISKHTGWFPNVGPQQGIGEMLHWLEGGAL